jgi:hypothetical protein
VTNKTFLRFTTIFRRDAEIAFDDILPAKQVVF